MDIGFYIADLLRNQDEVSLPGLGTFTKERVPGSYDSASNSFNPPSYQVSFTNKSSDFNTLSEYVSFKKNLSPSSAEYFVKKFTTGIFDVLQTSGIAEVKPLGIIRQKNENLVFEASVDFSIAGKFYGLKPVVDSKNTIATAVTDTVVPPPPTAGSSSLIEDFITGQGNEEIVNEEEYIEEPRGNRTLLLILGLFLFGVIVVALLYLFNPTTRNMVDRMFAKVISSSPAKPDSINVLKASPIITTDSVNAVPSAIIQDSITADSVVTIGPKEKEPDPIVEITTVEIITEAFKKRADAEKYVQTMTKKGFNARILDDMPGILLKVSLASFPDMQSAQEELIRIQKDINKQAWPHIYKTKKTK
jgi:hypothetical protein